MEYCPAFTSTRERKAILQTVLFTYQAGLLLVNNKQNVDALTIAKYPQIVIASKLLRPCVIITSG